MTPGARVQAAIEVLDDWLGGVALEPALSRWARGARYAGSKDRAAVRDRVFHAVRNRGRAAVLGGGEDGRSLMLGVLRLMGTEPATLFTGVGHAPQPLTDDEALAPSETPDILSDTPDWAIQELLRQPDWDIRSLLAAFAHRAPVYLRVNTAKTEPEAARISLLHDGVIVEPDPMLPTALRVQEGERKVVQSQAFADGLVELQDLSVQRAVRACPWPDRGRVLDYCAGGGGKTLALAPLTGAALFAHDANPKRMSDLPVRARRAGIDVSVLQTADLDENGQYEAVLCDVPCSGSGTWRRDPEAKWRMTPARLLALTQAQDMILAAASRLVAPGGVLIYMTCSLFRVENQDRIKAFVADHPDWSIETFGQDTPLTASDGFYNCVLRHDCNA